MEFVFYRDVFGGWRWECRDAKGCTYDSQHSYDTREECIEAAKLATPGVFQSETRPSRSLPAVLCVQPDPQLHESLQQALEGYRAILASNSLEAIRLQNSAIFDAYVLDYSLPGSSGTHLCRHIRRTDPHTPICFYTSAASEQQRNRAFKAGASAYVCLSAGPDSLRDELRVMLDIAELQSARAKVDEERAIQEELERRVVLAIDRSQRARELAAEATERAARARAYDRFIVSGGTPAHFERWWAPVFSGVSAKVSPAAPRGPAATQEG